MSENKHTPGPWKQDEVFRKCIVAESNPRESLLSLNCTAEYEADDEHPMATFANEADARLCAAAPELLAALKELVERREKAAKKHHYYADANAGSDGRYDRARAAIAKAEGR